MTKFSQLTQPVVKFSPVQLTPVDDYLATLHNPRWNDSEQGSILLDGIYSGVATTFLAHPNDPEVHGQEVWTKANSGGYGPIQPYAPPPPPTKDQLNEYTANVAGSHLGTSRNYSNPAGSISCAVGLEQGSLNQAHLWATTAEENDVYQWTDDNFQTFTLTPEQATQLWSDTTKYQRDVNAVQSQTTNGVASGAITSYAQIDSAPWPT